MGIKSQQDIKNESKAKSDKIPKSMESKAKEQPVTVIKQNEQQQPIVPLIERVSVIESYLAKVDVAFEKIVIEIDTLKKITHAIDSEMSKITGDFVRLTKLEEDRYIELATAINIINDKLTTMDEYIPVFIDKRLDDYFENLIAETGSSNEPVNDNQEPKQ
jgi:hypothetical protein